MNEENHVPVLKDECVDLLQPEQGKRIVDGTFGFGGHAGALLDRGATVLGLDLDDEAVAACEQVATRRPLLHCRKSSFRHLESVLSDVGWRRADGLLLDLGVSSRQLDDPAKGFTYRSDAPLDLRFDQTSGRTAAELVAASDEAELSRIFWEYGEERGSRRLARALVSGRVETPIETTGALLAALDRALPRGPQRTAALSRVFQALRIAVNGELEALADLLSGLVDWIRSRGRVVIISYHSLEDRLVKQWINREKKDCLCPPQIPECRCGHRARLKALTRKAVTASAAEIAANPRARSAKLRAAEIL